MTHAYLREDGVLDDNLPVWVSIPELAEIHIALETALAAVTALEGYLLKFIIRTSTVATVENHDWELCDQFGPIQPLSQSRAVALDIDVGHRRLVPLLPLLAQLHEEVARVPAILLARDDGAVEQHPRARVAPQ